MKPEEKARVKIDRMLQVAGWKVIARSEFTRAHSAVAVCESLMKGNLEADYLLFLDGKAIAVLEAKAEHIALDESVQVQAEQYARRLQLWCPYWESPLPITYISNGKELYFCDLREPNPQYRKLEAMHTPKQLVKLAGITAPFAALPPLKKQGLRDCQYEAITKLETSLRGGNKRALLVLATGSGKTFTACVAANRLLSYTPTKRILFLVDRNNLGKQAQGEFGTFRLTENGEPLSNLFPTTRLKSAHIPSESRIVISTIQRLFSLLTGQEIDDPDDEFYEMEHGTIEKKVELGSKLKLPKDYFDVIIIDECHRSIYGNWREVLNYFEQASLIGLTATPVPETLAFFNNELVINYSLEKSILDGINVDCRIYRIETRATSEGGTIKEGEKTREISNHTGKDELVAEEEDRPYGPKDLNRSIVHPDQIRLVLQSYKDAVYTDLYPEREARFDYLPKTLIFALSDRHASTIVDIARQVFGEQCDEFIQKITYSAGDSNELIRNFRNDKKFRIAVTVTLVATGTDIKPLEVLLFMRDVASDSLYTQMKGRGVRTIGDEQLRNVTPNAHSKDIFYLVDAVGVTEHDKPISTRDTDAPKRPISFQQLLEQISLGFLPDEHLQRLASSMARINSKVKLKQRAQFELIAGATLYDLAACIYASLKSGDLPPFLHVNESNSSRKALVEKLADNPKARDYLLELHRGTLTILVEAEDELIRVGFSMEEAHTTTAQFEQYISEHKDEIEALRIIYNKQGEPLKYQMLDDLRSKLLLANSHFKHELLWNHYSILAPVQVSKLSGKNERDALTNLIQIVRYAFKQNTELRSIPAMAAARFELWCGQAQRPLSPAQKELMKGLVAYIAANGSYDTQTLAEEDTTMFAQMVQAFQPPQLLNDMLRTLSRFILAA